MLSKFLRGLIKLLESFLLFIMPLVILYWLLLTMKLEMLTPFTTILGNIFSPFVTLTSRFYTYYMTFEGNSVDMTPLIFGLVLFVLFLGLCGLEKVLDVFDRLIFNIKIKAKKIEEKRNEEQKKAKFIEELAKNRVIYLSVKFRKKENSANYLQEETKLNSTNQIEEIYESIVANSKKYKATRTKQHEIEPNSYNFILYEIDDAIDFAFYIHNKVNAANNNLAEHGQRITVTSSCHCSYSENTAAIDFSVTQKLLGLGADNEIIVSELFRNKYEAKKEESNISFISKGLYTIKESCIEIFLLKINNHNK